MDDCIQKAALQMQRGPGGQCPQNGEKLLLCSLPPPDGTHKDADGLVSDNAQIVRCEPPAVSSVSRSSGRYSKATRKASRSPVCRLSTWASSAGGSGADGQTRRKGRALWSRAPGLCLSTSPKTASGTKTSEKSASKSTEPSSSRWISGPASHTTRGVGRSVIAMQAPFHVVHHHRLRHPSGMRL